MNRNLVVGLVVAGIVVVGGTLYLVQSRRGERNGEEGRKAAAGVLASREERGGSSGAAAAAGARGAATGHATGTSSGESGTAGAGAAVGLAGLKPRGGSFGEAVGSAAEAPAGEVEAVAPPAADKLATLKPQRGSAEQTTTVVGQMPAEGEPPPEVVFEGGKDQRFVTETQVQLENAGKIAGDAGTMAFWLKPDWEPSDQNDAVFVQIGEGQQAIRVAKNVNFLRFEYFDSNGRELGVGVPIDEWKPGEWHQVSATWVQGRLQLFVDGKPVSQNTFDIPPSLGEEPKAYVGSKLPSGTPAAGEMVDVRILNRPLQPNEIQDLARAENRPSAN
ncbi:MAG: LamG domain-containing protein [Candidatus Binatia bacterium]|nr:LamG domain-containing protein [Candidatus Binatia bacterium]